MTTKATHYTEVAALRLVNPLNVLARFARMRRGDDDTLAEMLQRDYGPMLGECDPEAVARSIEEDAAEITAILESYPAEAPFWDGEDVELCHVCDDSGAPCRVRMENDAADVAMEAGEPFLPVLVWMHTGGLSSLEDGITSMAEAYSRSAALAREEAEAERLKAEGAAHVAAILDKYRPVFFGK